MRPILVFAISLLFLPALDAQTKINPPETGKYNPEKVTVIRNGALDNQVFNSSKTIEIKGNIAHYIPDSTNLFISFRLTKLNGGSRDTSIMINPDGSFQARLFQPFEGDVSFYYNSGNHFFFTTRYLSPGGITRIRFDEKKLNDSSNEDAIVLTGNFSNSNHLFSKYNLAYKNHVFSSITDWRNSQLSTQELTATRIYRMKEELAFLSDFISKNKISDTIFINWQRNKIIYEAGADILFNYASSRNDKNRTYEELMQALKEIPLNNPRAIHNSSYFNFVNLLAVEFQIIPNINPKYQDSTKLNGHNSIPIALDYTEKYTLGICLQLMYYINYVTNHPSRTRIYLDRYRSAIKDPILRRELEQKLKADLIGLVPYDIVKRIIDYKVDDTIKTKLLKIFNDEKGNYLFVDFWGSWCGPCMLEMPVYPKFIDQFSKDSIHFVFLSYEMTNEEVDQIKNKFGIPGKFYLLNHNEIKILNNILGFESYPHHFIINPKSMVVNNSIASIESGSEPGERAVHVVRDILKQGNK